MSLCLDCVLFTLKGKPVKDNKYVQIFIMWLSICWKNAGLDQNDVLHIKMDSDTFEYLKDFPMFVAIHSKNTCPVKILLCPPPTTIQEGMMMKYIQINYEQDIYMYCDIDVLIVKPLRLLIQNIKPETIYVHTEGSLTNPNYSSCFTEEEISKITENLPGFSAGKFIIYGKNLYRDLLNLILRVCYENSKIHYTVEQPFFNKGIYGLNTNLYNIDQTVLTLNTVSPNCNFYSKNTTVLLDAMGEPGNGELHYDKILNFYILIQSGCM